jgi:hypothetical protein
VGVGAKSEFEDPTASGSFAPSAIILILSESNVFTVILQFS